MDRIVSTIIIKSTAKFRKRIFFPVEKRVFWEFYMSKSFKEESIKTVLKNTSPELFRGYFNCLSCVYGKIKKVEEEK